MPKSFQNYMKPRAEAAWLKRLVAACFALVLAVVMTERLGWLAPSQAALLQDPTPADSAAHNANRKVMSEDCGFLQNPEGVKGALSRHREEVALATQYLARNLNYVTSADLALVPPSEIPRATPHSQSPATALPAPASCARNTPGTARFPSMCGPAW